MIVIVSGHHQEVNPGDDPEFLRGAVVFWMIAFLLANVLWAVLAATHVV